MPCCARSKNAHDKGRPGSSIMRSSPSVDGTLCRKWPLSHHIHTHRTATRKPSHSPSCIHIHYMYIPLNERSNFLPAGNLKGRATHVHTIHLPSCRCMACTMYMCMSILHMTCQLMDVCVIRKSQVCPLVEIQLFI